MQLSFAGLHFTTPELSFKVSQLKFAFRLSSFFLLLLFHLPLLRFPFFFLFCFRFVSFAISSAPLLLLHQISFYPPALAIASAVRAGKYERDNSNFDGNARNSAVPLARRSLLTSFFFFFVSRVRSLTVSMCIFVRGVSIRCDSASIRFRRRTEDTPGRV